MENLPPRWEKRWQHFLDETREEIRSVPWYGGGAPDRPMHASFAYLVTNEPEFAEIARRDFRWMLDTHEKTLRHGCQDHDTWIYAAVLARRAISLDWLWSVSPEGGEVFDADEQWRFADFFITECLKYPYIVLKHRVPAHASNQGLAMALACVVTGYLFGVKHGSDVRACHLLEFGLPHLLQQIALLPPGGYSGEGSTYIFSVADPLMAIACATLEEIANEAWFERQFWPNCNSPSIVLRLGPMLIAPSGLLPAWDQHGYHFTKAGAACAYVAHRTGDASAYSHFSNGPGWELSGKFAWMRDDHVWQWIWMPDPRLSSFGSTKEYGDGSWAEARVAGALLDRSASLHLFQMWDLSAPRPVRMHMNPNSILLEAWGSLLTVDGNSTAGFFLDKDPRMQYLHQYSAEPKTLSWSAGSLGAHSVIWIDGAIDYRIPTANYDNHPGQTATGLLLRRVDEPEFQLLAAESALFYRYGFDVRSMIRNSALLDNAYWLILDQISADSVHEFTWQLVLRDGAFATNYGARLITAEHVVLDVINLDNSKYELHDVAGYPSLLEKRCHHFRKKKFGADVEFVTALIPRLARREIADWTEGWQGAWLDHRATSLDGIKDLHSLEFNETFYGRGPGALWLTRQCAIPLSEGPLILELPRPQPCRLWIDDVEIEVPRVETSKDGEQRLTAVFVDVTDVVSAKPSARLTLRIVGGNAVGSTGHVKLHQALTVPPPKVRRLDDDTIGVQFDGVDTTVDLNRIRTVPQPLPNFEPKGEDPLAVASDLVRRLLSAPSDDLPDWSGDRETREKACIAATRYPLEMVEDPLLRLCEDPEWLVRMLAIRALGRLRSSRALAKICHILEEETPEKINDPDYPPKYRIKEMCVLALGEIGDPKAAPALVRAMENAGFYGVRRLIPGVLALLKDRTTISALKNWLNDSDAETADACRRTLEQSEVATEFIHPYR